MIQLSEFSDKLHALKYRGPGESFREAVNRWAGALSDNSAHFNALQDIFGNQRFLMGGRCQSAIGSPRRVTPYNCFVSGTIKDTLFGRGSITDSIVEAMKTGQLGGGVGTDYSTIRPRGDRVKSLDSQASGPVSFMRVDNAGTQAIMSAGHRRGARMAVLRVDHPDIIEFIRCKQNETELTAFNISVGVTDAFMEALKKDDTYPLKFKGRTYDKIKARPLWEMIMQNTWDWSEPGVLFIDRINEMNNLWYCESIHATNPCGEQPLPPYGACLLGSFNLANYIEPSETSPGEYGSYEFNYTKLKSDIPHVVRAMDNIVDVADYPLTEQEDEAKSKRRMGLGVTGVANAIEACGETYGSSGFLEQLEITLTIIRDYTYSASIELAKEKGPFPLFDKDKYTQGKFIKTLPREIQEGTAQHGIRNSHLLSIAPTGTISMCANNVSSGIEPVIYYEADRTIQTFDGPTTVPVVDYGWSHFGVRGKLAQDCSISDHLNVQAVAQRYVDSAVSKTINFYPSRGGPDFYRETFKPVYMNAYEAGLKGITTFNHEGKRAGLFKESDTEGEGMMCGLEGQECG